MLHVFGYFAIELEIDTEHKIIDVSCTMLPSLGEKIVYNALFGNEIEEGIRNAKQQLEGRLYSTTKRAIIAALEDVHKRYKKIIKEEK